MENNCNGLESENVSADVFEVAGEPAIVIDGVPNVTPADSSPVHLDTISNADINGDPCFGDWLEGREVRKIFGDEQYFGKVVKYDSETKWYRVVYEDGDFEDLEWHELEEALLPLDISIPLKTLALRMCKCEKPVPNSGENTAKSRKGHMTNVGSMEKALVLLQRPQVSESDGEYLIEASLNSERTDETLKKQIETKIQSRNTVLQMCSYEKAVSRSGENTRTSYTGNGEGMEEKLELIQRPQDTELKGELMKANLNRDATTGKISKRQKEFQTRSLKTARAEKEKRKILASRHY